MGPQTGWLEAVANPIRLRIVRHLSERESASLDELSEAVTAQRNTVRTHLRALMSAGVVARTPG
ncbi:MAG: helix-turn-helix domain-containing protein, partial [Actinomycetota bacterium]|nr:helix-turn-helix domain-containing protein [Actinomycetota bacterium]